jgi:ferredoxin-NADP reductase
MALQEIALRRREQVAEGTFAFHFAKPAGFTHQAGQNALFSLHQESRPFTLASAPHEPELMIATRMRESTFKRALATLPIGASIRIDGPAGVMTLHEDGARPAVFLAGGIGITPFLSMVRDARARRLPHRIVLFYSNRRPQDAAFLREFSDIKDDRFRLVATMTEAPDWPGEKRRLSRELLSAHVGDLKEPLYYFAGPPGMTMAVQGMLGELGVREEDMRSEEFYGY